MADIEVEKAKLNARRGRRFRMMLTCIVLVLLCCGLTVLIGSILWFTNFIAKEVCGSFTKGSQPYNAFECEIRGESNGDVEEGDKFRIQEGTDEKVAQVTEEEVIVSKVFEDASPAVIGIGVKGAEGANEIIGTGFFVSPDGLIVTNEHVVSGPNRQYFLTLKDTEQEVEVKKIHRDVLNDIALIEVDGNNYPFLALGNSDNVKPGQAVIAIGNPLGKLEGTVTSGIISGVHREVEVSDGFNFGGRTTFQDVFQTDAAINPGNSGGPLLNSSGEVIGINFATISGADNLSFALPINRAKARISEINEFGRLRIPYLGVEYSSRISFVDNEVVLGAMVSNIEPGSPAEKAGLKRSDIIIGFNGTSLDDKPLVILIQESEIGETVKLSVLRDGELITLEATIGERAE